MVGPNRLRLFQFRSVMVFYREPWHLRVNVEVARVEGLDSFGHADLYLD